MRSWLDCIEKINKMVELANLKQIAKNNHSKLKGQKIKNLL